MVDRARRCAAAAAAERADRVVPDEEPVGVAAQRVRPGREQRRSSASRSSAIEGALVGPERRPAGPSGGSSTVTPKSAFRIAGVHTLDQVDDLGDVEVGRGAQVRVGRCSVQPVARLQQRDRGAHAVLHGDVEVLVQAGRDEVVRASRRAARRARRTARDGVLGAARRRTAASPAATPPSRSARPRRRPARSAGRRRRRARPAPAPAGRAWRPTVSRLMSMLPPCGPGGTECGRSSPATATPMMPRNGASGNATDARRPRSAAGSPSAAVRRRPCANTLTVCRRRGYSPGSAPRPCRLEMTP